MDNTAIRLKANNLHRSTDQGERYAGIVCLSDRVVWTCGHMHTTGWAAVECAQSAIDSGQVTAEGRRPGDQSSV